MSRTILYYPSMHLPTEGAWLRRALLYNDYVATIIPKHIANDERHRTYMDRDELELYDQGVLKMIDPREGLFSAEIMFLEALVEALENSEHVKPGSSTEDFSVPVLSAKVRYYLHEYFEARGFSRTEELGSHHFFTREAAAIYLTLLAKYIAKGPRNDEPGDSLMIPATDDPYYLDWAFRVGREIPEPTISVSFTDAIPIPAAETPLRDIIRFREKHKDELFRLRNALDSYPMVISNASSTEEISAEMERLKRDMELGISDVQRAMRAFRITTFFGSLQSFIKPTSPTLVGAAAVAAGAATSLGSVPVSWLVAGATAAGIIEVAAHLHKQNEELRRTKQNQPYTYLFLARNKFRER